MVRAVPVAMSIGPPLSQNTMPSCCWLLRPPVRLISRTARRMASVSSTSCAPAVEKIPPMTRGALAPSARWVSRVGGSVNIVHAGSVGKVLTHTPATHAPPPAALRQSWPVVQVAASVQKPAEQVLPGPKASAHWSSLPQSSCLTLCSEHPPSSTAKLTDASKKRSRGERMVAQPSISAFPRRHGAAHEAPSPPSDRVNPRANTGVNTG